MIRAKPLVSKPLVSVLISNYNYDRYLQQAIDSALSQTYPHLEIIVVDDGSTDDSRKVIAHYGQQVIPVLKENGGQASAFNAGFAVSQGELICLLDADDIWLPEKVERIVEAAGAFPQASVIYHRVQNVDQAGQASGQPWPPYTVIRGNIFDQVKRTGGWWPFPPSTGLSFSRSFLDQVMNIPEQEYRICADTYLADLSPFFGDVVGIDQTLSQFRIHAANNWSNPVDMQRRSLQSHELRVSILNRVLSNVCPDTQISLNNHLPYQRLKHQLGEGASVLALSQLAFQNPWEVRLTSRLKAIAQLWLKEIRAIPHKTPNHVNS